jgi:PTH1 family peptidyl-tRNA hydrolase
LGNPGPQYAKTRHNAGADWVRELARQFHIPMTLDSKFKAEIGRGIVLNHDVRLLIPVTYMNNSGDAIGAAAHFFKWSAEEILIAHDEVAFEPGTVKLKNGGGENGHNGLKSVRARLGNRDGYNRLRIGVGHPGNKNKVNYYLTQQTPTEAERASIAAAGQLSEGILRDMLAGNWQSAMTALHAPEKNSATTPSAEHSDQQHKSGENDGV